MSAFDDEFGLFGDEEGEEEERKSTLGARKIASSETIIDEIEPEDEPSPRRFRGRPGAPDRPVGGGGFPGRRQREREPRAPLADDVAIPRAVELLTFLAQKLVSKPDAVRVEVHRDEKGTVLELFVAADDVGKVIGRAGRVAQALRTVVRAGAEGRVTVDIVDVDEIEAAENGDAPKAERGRRGRGRGAAKAETAVAASVETDGEDTEETDDEHEVEVIYVIEEDDGDETENGDDADAEAEGDDEIAAKPKRGAKKSAKKASAATRGAKKSTGKAAAVKSVASASPSKKTAPTAAAKPAAKSATKSAARVAAKPAKAAAKPAAKTAPAKPAAKKAVAKVAAKKAPAKAAAAKKSAVKKTAARKKKS